MTLGKAPLLLLALLPLAACSSSSSKAKPGTLDAALQDLTADPDGLTTVLTFSRAMGNLAPGHFEADGGQLATSVTVSGATVTVVWGDRVTPSHQVRAVGIKGIPDDYVAVATSNANAPTFVISNGTQTAGLGGDSFQVQFSGPRVAAETAEDTAAWELSVGGTLLSLTGSTLTFDEGLQRLDVTLGTSANLHAAFQLEGTGVTSVADVTVAGPVAGTASGDAAAPSLVSAVQNLSESEFGLVVDLTFDEAMDPVLNPLTAFDPSGATLATVLGQPSEETLRVRFNAPIIPGQDTLDLIGVIDAHGNALNQNGVNIAAGSTVANGYAASTPTVSTVANVGGDQVVIQLVQAIDPDVADLPATWDFESPTGNDVDLSTSTLTYSLTGKTLTIDLADDLVTGDTWSFGPAGAVLDVDGEAFVAATNGTVGGDATAPMVSSVTQNRVLDPDGFTFEVVLSEDVEQAGAETTGNYVFTSGSGVTSATLQPDGNTVRLVLDTRTMPGTDTVAVSNLVDIAGNAQAPAPAAVLVSTDSLAPASVAETVLTVSGAENDTLTVVFDDELLTAEVTDPANWLFESPTGSMLDTTGVTIDWNAVTYEAVLTFDGATTIDLTRGDTWSLQLVTMRDIGGNEVDAGWLSGLVGGEDVFPNVVSAWVEDADATKVHLRFDEPVQFLDDALSSYVIRDAAQLDVGGGPPTVVVDADRMGATLTWAVGVVAGVHTIDVRGVSDLAGNQMFPEALVPIEAELSSAPALVMGLQKYLAVSGERNDTIDMVLDQPLSPWSLLDPANYTLTNGMDVANFELATLSYDGSAVVSVTFDVPGGLDFDNGAYTLTVDGLMSAQGLLMGGASMETAVADAGTDMTAPQPVAGRTRLDAANPGFSVLVEMDEALDATEAVDVTNYEIGAVNPDTVELLGPRTVRATWGGGVTAGQMLDVTGTDLAGNAALATEAVQVAETAGPAVVGVAGIVAPGIGGDAITVTFSRPVNAAQATSTAKYTVSVGGQELDLLGAVLSYSSATNTVTIPLTVDLLETDLVNVMVTGIDNHAGITMADANVNGSIAGDGVAPALDAAYTNLRADAGGLMVELRFTEDVDPTFATNPLNYASTGGQTVQGVALVRPDTVRISLASALGGGDQIEVTGAQDLAGNVAGTLSITPLP